MLIRVALQSYAVLYNHCYPTCGARGAILWHLWAPGAFTDSRIGCNPCQKVEESRKISGKPSSKYAILETVLSGIFFGVAEGKLFNGNLLKKCVSCRFSHNFRQLNTKFLVIDEYYALPKHVSGYLLDVFIEIQYGPIISNHLSKGIPTPKGRIP